MDWDAYAQTYRQLDEAAPAVFARGNAGGAIAAMSRAADLSATPAARARRLAKAAWFGVSLANDSAVAERLLTAAHEADRAITEAEWQHVVYDEYLPKLVGENAIKDYKGYKSSVNPAVINEWTTVAFRFGHDQSSNVFRTLAENGGST